MMDGRNQSSDPKIFWVHLCKSITLLYQWVEVADPVKYQKCMLVSVQNSMLDYILLFE